MNLKELPAFEINEFKVGDRVRVYDSQCLNDDRIGIVEEVDEDEVVVKIVDYEPGYNYNFKQCRKLEEVILYNYIYRTPKGNLQETNFSSRSWDFMSENELIQTETKILKKEIT